MGLRSSGTLSTIGFIIINFIIRWNRVFIEVYNKLNPCLQWTLKLSQTVSKIVFTNKSNFLYNLGLHLSHTMSTFQFTIMSNIVYNWINNQIKPSLQFRLKSSQTVSTIVFTIKSHNKHCLLFRMDSLILFLSVYSKTV